MDERIHRPMVLRLARYLRVLEKLKGLGFVKVFSNNLGDAIGATPAVVRKDFSVIGISGNKRGGYTIDTLIERLVDVLGKRDSEDVIIVGCGRIGTALLNYREFQREGIRIVACFDNNEDCYARDAPIPVLPVTELAEFVRSHDIQVAVLAVPDQFATSVFETMVNSGIRGVLNFTSVELKCNLPEGETEIAAECTVQNVNIGLEIENLFYMIRLTNAPAQAEVTA